MNPARVPLILILAASAAVVGAALLSQYWGGLAPCELCLDERWPYYLAIAIALLALAFPRPGLGRAALLLLVLVFLASAALGFYHLGVERHWFAGPSSCTSTGRVPQTLEELKALLARTQVVMCDQPQWTLWGISLAGWNFVASMLIAAFGLWTWKRSA
ncbi:MAG TPA: disulfide bond formation protein B [Stellaceae bacterium]|nr:disulfide bond formation protein B [Stellaceae bacterium]